MIKLLKNIQAIIILLLVFYVDFAHSAVVSFSGSLKTIEIDNGASVYSGATIGDTFSGNIIVSDSSSDATSVGGDTVSSEYTFTGSPYGIVIGNDVNNVSSSFAVIVIDDNYPGDAEGIDELNKLFGTSLPVGTQLDAWAAFGHTDGAVVDVNDNLSNGLEFGIIYGFDPSVYSGLDYRATPPEFASVSYPYFYISESDSDGNQIFFALGILESSMPAEVTSANIWLARSQDTSSNSTNYAFYTDVYGTVSAFKAITLTSPLNNKYDLGLSPEGDQWGSDTKSSQSVIDAEFPDGTYTFDVTYTDDSTEQISVELSGEFPPYPENVTVTSTQLSWNLWMNSAPSSSIEFVIEDSDDNFINETTGLSASDTSYTLINELMLDEKTYNVNLSFVNVTGIPQYSAYKSSSTIVTAPTPTIIDQTPSSEGNGGGSGGGSIYVGFLVILLRVFLNRFKSIRENNNS